MKFREAFDRFLFNLSVPTCVCCRSRLDYGELAFCPKCSVGFEENKTRNCSKCVKLLCDCSCSSEYLSAHFVKKVVKCFRYDTRGDHVPSNSLIFSLKKDFRDDVLKRCTLELCRSIQNSITVDDSYIITNVPRRRGAVVEYGIDHSEMLAKCIAENFGVTYVKLLRSKVKVAQKSLSREERMKNADFELIKDLSLKNKNIIIVDDIITTGASVGACASMLRALSPKNIIAASLAIAYRDDA